MEIAFLFFIIFYNFKEAFFRPSQNPRRVFDFIALIRSTARKSNESEDIR